MSYVKTKHRGNGLIGRDVKEPRYSAPRRNRNRRVLRTRALLFSLILIAASLGVYLLAAAGAH